jgi:hypothetical protein
VIALRAMQPSVLFSGWQVPIWFLRSEFNQKLSQEDKYVLQLGSGEETLDRISLHHGRYE